MRKGGARSEEDRLYFTAIPPLPPLTVSLTRDARRRLYALS